MPQPWSNVSSMPRPDIGELVPDIEVVDDHGNPVNIREVATGQFTVLVLGCLT